MDQLQSSTAVLQPPPPPQVTTAKSSTTAQVLPSTIMDQAKIPNGDYKCSAALQSINAKIDKLQTKLLPPIPHLLSVPTTDPYRGARPWETHRNTPFEAYEFEELQYMTLVPGDVRGVARPRGGWEDEINARSPHNISRSRSGTTTPQADRDPTKPRSRITLADYNSGKRVRRQTGEPPSGPVIEKAKDNGEPVAVKVEPTRVAQNGTTHAAHISPTKPVDTNTNIAGQKPNEPRTSEQKSTSSRTKENNHDVAASKPKESQLPASRPEKTKPEDSNIPAPKPAEQKSASKRPLEKPDQPPPEKRIKVDSKPAAPPSGASMGHQRNPSDPMSKFFGTAPKSKPSTPKLSPPTSITVEYTPSKRPDAKKHPERAPVPGNKEKESPPTRVPEMPKLLSPLPDYLTSPNPVSFNSTQTVPKPVKSDQTSPFKSPNTTTASQVAKKTEHTEKQSPLRLPELLPRELPPNVEELLAKSKHPTKKLDSVQARHERSRDPDAPGVARKAPKLSAAEKRRASKASDSSPPAKFDEPPRLIVKLKYKKSMAKNIERILKTKPVRNRNLLELSDGIVPDKPAASKAKAKENKRPRAPDEQQERSIKRAKLPAKIEAVAPTTPLLPAFKSPAGQKAGSISKVTPKKGDAMKSVVMRRVDSTDDNSLTPKTGGSISTPASVEKPRLNGSDPKAAEVEKYRNANNKYVQIGTSLKRKRDGYLLEKNHQLSTLAGAESLLSYAVAFDAFDKQCRLTGKANTGENWVSLFPLLQANHEPAKTYPVLHIVILLLGGVAANALLTVHNQRFVEELPSNTPGYLRFRDAMSMNIRRGKEFWEMYHTACQEFAAKEPEAVKPGGPMAFICAPGGQARPIKTIRVEVARMLREYVKKQKLEWEMQVDF